MARVGIEIVFEPTINGRGVLDQATILYEFALSFSLKYGNSNYFTQPATNPYQRALR
jgi:hypothetical protein